MRYVGGSRPALSSECSILGANPALSESLRPYFNFEIEGGDYPVLRATTNYPDGTMFFINLKKPWLPDGSQRLARGLPACEDDCISAMGPNRVIGAVITIQQGALVAGPFSFNSKPFRPGIYPIEISRPFYSSDSIVDQTRAMGVVAYQTAIRVGNRP